MTLVQSAKSVSVAAPASGPGSYNTQAHQMLFAHIVEYVKVNDKIKLTYFQQRANKNDPVITGSPFLIPHTTTKTEITRELLKHFSLSGLSEEIADSLATLLLAKLCSK